MKTIEEKRKEAFERNSEWAELSPAAKLAALDRRLGVGVGAKKQRAKLAKALKAETKPVDPEVVKDIYPKTEQKPNKTKKSKIPKS